MCRVVAINLMPRIGTKSFGLSHHFYLKKTNIFKESLLLRDNHWQHQRGTTVLSLPQNNMRALWCKPKGWWRITIVFLPGSGQRQRLGKQLLIYNPPSSACVDTKSAQERLPTVAWEGKFSLLNLVRYLGHMFPVVLLCGGKRRADSLRVAKWLIQERESTEQRVLGTGRGAVKDSDNAWAKWDCHCLISAELAQQRRKELSSLIRAQWASLTG